MTELVALDSKKHASLCVAQNRNIQFIRARHMVPLLVTEIGQAVSQFPVVVSRVSQSSEFALSALCSFVPGANPFLDNDEWDAGFIPSAMQTYPFYLMRPEKQGEDPGLGFDPENPLFGEKGDPLLDKRGKPVLWLSGVHAKLKEDVGARIHTIAFLKDIYERGLIRPVNIVVNFAEAGPQTIQGLHLINEDALHSLSADDLVALREKGYLGPVYAMLFSTFQLNSLIRRHNKRPEGPKITDIKLEVSKPAAMG